MEENIRHTEDGKWWSVYDVIGFVTGTPQKSRTNVYQRIVVTYPAVQTKCQNWKFSGARQKLTPVMTRRGVLELVMLLPGVKAAKYRKEWADILVRFFDADASIAESIIDRNDNPEDLARIEERARVKKTTLTMHGEMAKRGATQHIAGGGPTRPRCLERPS